MEQLKAKGLFVPKKKADKPPQNDSKQRKKDTTEKKRKSEGDEGAERPQKKAKKAAGGSGDKALVFPVLVRGLGEVSVADLQDVFSECGEIKSVKIAGGGKAILVFAAREAAGLACKLHGTEMDGGVIKVSKLSPEDASTAAAADGGGAASAQEEDDGLSLSVCINSVPEEATVDELKTACEAFGQVVKVKKDKKRANVAFCEFASKVSARLAAKRSVRVGRVLCKAVHLRSETVATSESKAAAAGTEPGAVKKQRGENRTVLVKGLAAGVTEAQVRSLFGDAPPEHVRFGGKAGDPFVFADFATKTAFRKALRVKSPTFQGRKLVIHEAKRVAEAEASTAAAPARARPASCRTILVKNLAYSSEPEVKLKAKIARVFKVCGAVKEVRLFMDRGTEAFKGMCFVEFAEAEALSAALQMNGACIASARARTHTHPHTRTRTRTRTHNAVCVCVRARTWMHT